MSLNSSKKVGWIMIERYRYLFKTIKSAEIHCSAFVWQYSKVTILLLIETSEGQDKMVSVNRVVGN